MNLLIQVLATVAAAGVMGIAGAETHEPGETVETSAPTATEPLTAILSLYPFAQIADLPAGAERLLLEGQSVGDALAGAWPEISSADLNLPAPASLSGAQTDGSFVSVVSNRNEAFSDPSAGEVPAAYPYSAPGTAGWKSGAVFPIPIDEIPEPSSWMLLLCGLAAAAFMARRKRGTFTD